MYLPRYTVQFLSTFAVVIAVFGVLYPGTVFAARLFSSGCELEGASPGNMTNNLEWARGGDTPANTQVSSSEKRTGLASCRVVTSPTEWASIQHQYRNGGPVSDMYFRFYLKFNSLPSENVDIFNVVSSNGTAGQVILRANGTIMWSEWYGGEVQVGTTVLQVDQWNRIEIAVATSGSGSVRINGVQELTFTQLDDVSLLDTFTIGVGYCSQFDECDEDGSQYQWGDIATADLYFDDIAVNDGTGSYQNSWPGEGSIVHMQANGAGNAESCINGGTFDAVNDVSPDGDSTRCELTGTGSILSEMESPSSAQIPSGQTITLVQVGVREKLTLSSATSQWQTQLKSRTASGGPLATGVTTSHDDTTYRTNGDVAPRNYTLTAYIDPTTGVAWTQTGTNSIDNMQTGMACVSCSTSNIYATAVWALVEYVSPPPGPAFNLGGYAWSPNIGWVSFNCINISQLHCDTISNYKVSVSSGTPYQTITGYAWSSAVGWISFMSSDVSGCPASPCTARMDTVTGAVTGWAKVLSADAGQSGGWGGWIHLADTDYGVLGNGPEWTGYAWGGGPTTGTGVFSPARGGNAVVGWISFRGFTAGSVPTIYGVTALGTTVGPYSMACGVSANRASTYQTVTWTAVVNTSILTGTTLYDWNTTGGILQGRENHESTTRNVQYDTTGVKRASIVVTNGGKKYIVTCSTGDVPGVSEPSPWYSEIYIGDINLQFLSAPTLDPGGLKAGVDTIVFNANANCVEGTGVSPQGCDFTVGDPLTLPFDNVIQIVKGVVSSPQAAADYFRVTAPQVTSIYAGQDVPADASWAPQEADCPWGTGPCTFSARACADVTLSGPDFDPVNGWNGVVCEQGEVGCLGSFNSNNCSSWMQFSVEEADAPPPSGGTCRAVPGITQVGRTVTWSIDPTTISGGEPPFEYKWEALPDNTGADALCGTYEACADTDNIETKTYTNASPATKRAQVTVRDAGGQETAAPIVCTGIVRLQRLEEF